MQLAITAWVTPGDAHDATSPYVEEFWLPVLGPTGFVALRHLARLVADAPGGVHVDVADLSARLGVGRRDGAHARLRRTLTRLERFGLVAWRGPQEIAVRPRVPWLPPRHERRLPDSLRVKHARRRAYARPR